MRQSGAADVLLQTQGQIYNVCQHPSPQNSFWHDEQVVLVSGSIIDKQEFINTGGNATLSSIFHCQRKKISPTLEEKLIHPAMRGTTSLLQSN